LSQLSLADLYYYKRINLNQSSHLCSLRSGFYSGVFGLFS